MTQKSMLSDRKIAVQLKINEGGPAVAQQVKDMVLFLWQHRFKPCPSTMGKGSSTAAAVAEVSGGLDSIPGHRCGQKINRRK